MDQLSQCSLCRKDDAVFWNFSFYSLAGNLFVVDAQVSDGFIYSDEAVKICVKRALRELGQ